MNANDVLGGLVERATKTTRPAKLVSNLETVPSGYRVVAHGYYGDLCIFPEQPCNRLTLADEILFVDAVNALPRLLAVVAAARKLVAHTCDFELETALAALDREVCDGR